MRRRVTAAAISICLVLGVSSAHAITAHLITGASLVDATPGADFRIGTADDGRMAGGIPPNGSGPNAHGAASFAALNESATVPSGTNFDHLLFVDGTIEFTPDYTASTADTLVLRIDGGSLRSTAEFNYPTRGEATTSVVGTMARMSLATRQSTVQLTGNFAPGGATAFPLNNEVLTSAPGLTTIVLRPMFGHSGDAYMDVVLTPLLPANATSLICVEFTGTVATRGHLLAVRRGRAGLVHQLRRLRDDPRRRAPEPRDGAEREGEAGCQPSRPLCEQGERLLPARHDERREEADPPPRPGARGAAAARGRGHGGEREGVARRVARCDHHRRERAARPDPGVR
jgi:hypothetical protein